MATNNPIDSLDPIQVALGGLGTTTLAADGVLYANGTSAVGVTSVGTVGQVLTSNGSTAPTFQAISGGTGALVLIASKTLSSTSTVFTSGITSTYNNYLLDFNNATLSGTDQIIIQFSSNGGSSYSTSGYQSQYWYPPSGGPNYINISNGLIISDSMTDLYGSNVFLMGLTGGKSMEANGYSVTNSANLCGHFISMLGLSNINALKILTISGATFTGGTAKLYGLVN